MKIVISSGHGKNVSGAVGIINEVTEARRVVPRVAEYFEMVGVDVIEFHENTATNRNANVSAIVAYHNSQTRDLDISLHFNAFRSTSEPMGVEVLFLSESERALAAKVSKAIADVSGLRNRGAKFREDLWFLNGTKRPAILIEVCFVDSMADVSLYNAKFDDICRAIAVAISGRNVVDEKKVLEETLRFNKIEEMPDYARGTIQKLIDKGILKGGAGGLNLSEDMIRIFVVNDRAGLYNLK